MKNNWNPKLYLKFEKERTQPAIDLVNRIQGISPTRIIDIGCGPGNSTNILRDYFPKCEVIGIDSSTEMINQANENYDWGNWILGDVTQYEFEGEFDIIFSNAALQWIESQENLIEKLINHLSEKGLFAVQVPANYDSPIFKSLIELSSQMKWHQYLSNSGDAIHYKTPEFYYNLLTRLGLQVNLWTTTYYHVLNSVKEILEWYGSTGLRPYLSALPDDEARDIFKNDLLDYAKINYPCQHDGNVLFQFKRTFFIAKRK